MIEVDVSYVINVPRLLKATSAFHFTNVLELWHYKKKVEIDVS